MKHRVLASARVNEDGKKNYTERVFGSNNNKNESEQYFVNVVVMISRQKYGCARVSDLNGCDVNGDRDCEKSDWLAKRRAKEWPFEKGCA